MILEAGGTGGATEYADLQARLAGVTQVCAYDRAGMGWSDPVDAPLDAGLLAADLERLLAAAEIAPPWALLAGSAGGLTAELFARNHPDDVRGLMLLDALHGDLLDADVGGAGAARLARKAWLARGLASVGLLAWIDPYDLDRLPPGEWERAVALKYHAAPWRAVTSLIGAGPVSRAQLAAAPPLRDDLPLVVVTHDPARSDEVDIAEPQWRDGQARMAARSSRGRLIVAAGCGHHPEIDRPDLVAAWATAWWAETR